MKYILITTLFLSLFFSSCIKEPEFFKNTQEGNFEALWSIVDTRYCYLEYKEINWDSIRVVYSSRLGGVSNKYEMFDLFSDMLNELKDGHVNLFSDFDVSRYDKWYTAYPKNYYPELIFSENSEYIGREYRTAGALIYGRIKKANTIGYISCRSFLSALSNKNIKNVFDYFKDCEALIIDVRSNGGGAVSNAEQLASCFFEETTITGYMQHKTGPGHSDFSKPIEVKTSVPKDTTLFWRKPVVVLCNRGSYSATNDFVCRMKYAPNASIIGTPTGGGGGLPFSSELPCGWMLRFSASPMFDREMQNIEHGIAPKVFVEITDFDLQNKRDAVIEKAVEILSQ